MESSPGSPTPLGPHKEGSFYNFSVYSEKSTQAYIAIFQSETNTLIQEFPMHRTGVVWHISLKDVPPDFSYAYRMVGPFSEKDLFNPSHYLLDPYAPLCNSPHGWGEAPPPLLGKGEIPSFTWDGDRSLHYPLEQTIIYEMHVRGFTNDPSSGVQHPGTYLGMIEKIPYLKELGITAVELMPLYEFNERSHRFFDTPERLTNYWGYSTVSFFAPMNRFAVQNSATELKALVLELHKAGIEVILDVVYNHTNEGNSKDYYESFRGIANASYYMLTADGSYYNFSGCGNTINCNHPMVRRFVLDSLVHWVEEYHIDGFRFDLASILTRGEDGIPLQSPPLIEEMCSDPRLAKTKLIAEAWDCGGLYQIGSFPRGDRFSEWNGIYRDTVRRYIRGESKEYKYFADMFLGSPSIYRERGPYASINFITAHDGFTLYDLTAYNEKHNEMNREDNRDGHNENESWNCGVEGETLEKGIQHLRKKQYQNFMATLLLSKGVPMVLMGDEYGHTRHGNNNAWCHDNFLNYFLWETSAAKQEYTDIVKTIISLRKKYCTKESSYVVHETNDFSLFLCTIGDALFFALNISDVQKDVKLPEGFDVVLGKEYYTQELAPHASLVAEKRQI